MYSVEDLLISHGYKPARDAAAPCEDKSERCRSTRTGPRAGQGLLNGYKDGATAHTHSRTSLGTGHVSNSETASAGQEATGSTKALLELLRHGF